MYNQKLLDVDNNNINTKGKILSEKKEELTYLILSFRSPMQLSLHKILSEIASENLLLVTGTKAFSEKEQEELAPFFKYIIRVKNYRDTGNLELEVYNLYKIQPFQKIIAYHEYDLLRAARIRDFFQLEGQNYQSALAFRDKILMKNILSKAGIKVPIFSRISSPFDILEFTQSHGFPIVIKPIFGTGADGVFILNTVKEVQEFISTHKGFNDCYLSDIEVEQFIPGTTYHVDGFIQEGKIVASWPSICINHCIDLRTGAYVAHHHLAPENPMVMRLNNYARSVLQVLPTPKNTAFLLEVFYNAEKDEIIFCEIAARVGGGVKEMWPEAFGIDLENEFIRIQANLTPSTTLTQFSARSNEPDMRLNAISGWIIFPKVLDALKSIPDTTPFPWVKKYIVRAKTKVLNLLTKNVSDSLASAFIIADSELQFKERTEQLNAWLQQALQWEKISVSPNVIKCIETCEESIKQLEKIDTERVKKIISIQEEWIAMLKNTESYSASTTINAQDDSTFIHTSSLQNNPCHLTNAQKDRLSSVMQSYNHDTFAKMKKIKSIENQTNPVASEHDNRIEEKLKSSSLTFFNKPMAILWKTYPASKLVGKYLGHQIRFFTMLSDTHHEAKAFTDNLQQAGFSAELKKVKENPCIIVDLTTSKLKI